MEQILLSRAVGEDSAEWVQEAEAGIRHSSQQNLKQELPQRLLKKAEDPEPAEQGREQANHKQEARLPG